jgi:hypothetical protein
MPQPASWIWWQSRFSRYSDSLRGRAKQLPTKHGHIENTDQLRRYRSTFPNPVSYTHLTLPTTPYV